MRKAKDAPSPCYSTSVYSESLYLTKGKRKSVSIPGSSRSSPHGLDLIVGDGRVLTDCASVLNAMVVYYET